MNQDPNDFDHYAENYEDLLNDNISFTGETGDYFAEYRIKRLAKIPLGKINKILDVGCSNGNTAAFFAREFPNAKITGIDISQKSIDIAKSKNIPQSEFLHYDGLKIPFGDESFDLVHFANVLHHVPFNEHNALMNEVNRVLKKGGKVVVFEHNPWNPLTRYVVSTCAFDKEARLLFPRYLKNLIKKSHLKYSHKGFLFFLPRHRLFKFLFPIEKYLTPMPIGAQYYMIGEKA